MICREGRSPLINNDVQLVIKKPQAIMACG